MPAEMPTADDGCAPEGLTVLSSRRHRVALEKAWTNRTAEVVRSVGPNIWVIERSYTHYGMNVGGKTTVVKLTSGGLFVHGPLALTKAIVQTLAAIGPVEVIVAANTEHCDFTKEWIAFYPEAKSYGCPSLREKHPNFGLSGDLGYEAAEQYVSDIEHIYMEGIPVLHEVVFFHRESKSLIVTDMFLNIPSDTSFMTKIFKFTWNNVVLPLFPMMMVKDREAFDGCVQRVLDWPFEQVIPCHGDIVSREAKDVVRQYLGVPNVR